MIPLDITSLETNIRVIVTSNIMKDYVNNDDQFIRKTAILQDKFLDWLDYVLATTWYTFILGFIYKPMALQREDQYLRPQQKYIYIYICRLMKNCNIDGTAPSKSLGEIYLMMSIPSLNVCTWKRFRITPTIFIKTLNLLWREKVMESIS